MAPLIILLVFALALIYYAISNYMVYRKLKQQNNGRASQYLGLTILSSFFCIAILYGICTNMDEFFNINQSNKLFNERRKSMQSPRSNRRALGQFNDMVILSQGFKLTNHSYDKA